MAILLVFRKLYVYLMWIVHFLDQVPVIHFHG